MKEMTSIIKKAGERVTFYRNKNQSIVKPVLFKFPHNLKQKRKLMISAGTAVVIIGFLLLFSQSAGYNVYCGEEMLGFVESPEIIIDNIDNINERISKEKDMEATVYEKDFTFEKGHRFFYDKDDVEEIASAVEEKCDIDVNIYDIYIDDTLVGQDTAIEPIQTAMENKIRNFADEHSDEKFETVEFAQNVEIRMSKGLNANAMNEEEIEGIVDNLSIRTVSEVTEQITVPYEIVKEMTDVIDAGTTTVKTTGEDGIIESVKKVEKIDDKEVSSEEIASTTLKEKVDQIVLIGTKGLVISDAGMASPSRGTVSSEMGPRWGRLHKGIDIAGNMNDAICAAKDGTVIAAEYEDNGYGNIVKIDHGDGMVTVYAHLNEIFVQPGEEVFMGQKIAGMGSSGRSTGPHLHFEVLINGVNVDPRNYVDY